MNRSLFFLVVVLCSFLNLNAQVGIGTTSPSSAAALHLSTENFDTVKRGGFIMPIVTEAQQALIPVTAIDDGLMVFVSDSTTGKWCWDIYDAQGNNGGGVWRSIKCNTPMVAVCDTQIYLEDFSGYALHTGRDKRTNSGDYPGGVTWTINDTLADYFNQDSDYAYTNAAEEFELNDTDGPISFSTPTIDISAYTTICFSVDIRGEGDLEYDPVVHSTDNTNNKNDYVNVEYAIDGGAWVLITNFGGNGNLNHTLIAPNPQNGTFPNGTVSETGLSGSTIKIRITSSTWAATEYFFYDNIIIEGGN